MEKEAEKELLKRLHNLECDVNYLMKREKSLFEYCNRLLEILPDSVADTRLTYAEDCITELRETNDFIMDKVFPDNCIYRGDIRRALEAFQKLPPSKSKG